MLAAVVIDMNPEDRDRIKENLETYWEFDKVLAVEKAVDLEALLKTEEYKDVRFILIINNNGEDLDYLSISTHGFPPIKIVPETDPTDVIRKFLESV